jgi:pimeloyl-ACP methyl ester carboxylesterase
VLGALRESLRRFSIDTDRVFLSGHSMGGDAAWDIGLAHPDLWAGLVAISPAAGKYVNHYWHNARTLPMYLVGGELDAASFGGLLVTSLLLRPLPPQHAGQTAGLRSILAGMSYLRGRQALQGIYLIDLNAMIFGMPRALFPALAAGLFHVGPQGLGLLYAAPGIGALVGASTTGWAERVERRGRAVVVAVIIWGAAVAVMGAVPWLWVALVLLAIAGWADVISAVLRNAILQSRIEDQYRGRLSAIQIAVVTGGPRLGDLESGAVAGVTSTAVSVVSGGLACVVGSVFVAWHWRGFWNERANELGSSDASHS